MGAVHTRVPSPAGGARAGSSGGARAGGPRHADLPGRVRTLQAAAGNRAVAALLARQPAPSGRFNDYADLLNDFQELAAAALNRGGKGLEGYRLGRNLSVSHRNLLEDVRKVLIDGQATSPLEARQSAAADWRRVAAKLKASLDDARKLGIRGAVIAAVTDDIALVGETYLHARVKAPSEVESGEDYHDTVIAVQDLLDVFDDAPEASLGVIREEVQGRADAAVNTAMREVNEKQRKKLRAVTLGEHLLARHRAVVEKLRQAMLLARSETPGSAYKALSLWKSIKSELEHVMTRAPTFVAGDVSVIARRLDGFGAALATHYELVHTETLATALKPEPKPAEVQADRMLKQLGQTQARAKLHETRVFEQFRYMLDIIEHGLTRIPGHPGEWLLTSGSLKIRIRDDQTAQVRAVAATELKGYMAHLVKEMVAAAETYDAIKRGNSSFKLHLLGGWGGASDPGSQDHYRVSVMEVRDKIVYPMVDRGELVKAFDMVMAQKGVVERQAKEVADYDEDLDVGYNRLARSMQVLEVALTSLVPVAGEAALVSGASVFAVGGTAIAAGTGGAVIAEGTREIASGEGLDAAKLAGTGRKGLAISVGALAPAATKALGGVLGAGQPGVAGMLAGGTAKAGVTDLIADTVATGTVGGTQSAIGGGSFGQGFVGSSITGMGMHAVKGAGITGPVGTTVGSAGAGAFGAWASGGDPIAGGVGGVGSVGGAVANVAGLTTPRRPPGGGQDGVPVHVGPEGDATYHGPAPGGVPVPVGAKGDATYHGPVPGGVPVRVGPEGDATYHGLSEAAVINDLSALNHGWTNVNSEWFELEGVNWAELIRQHPEDRLVWENLKDAYGIVRDPQKLAKGVMKIYEGAAREGITPEEWLLNYFGGRDGMPRLVDPSLSPEYFRRAMLADKPALDNTLQDDRHGLLTHMFQEFVLAEEWGSRAKARDFRHAIARVKGPAAPDGKQMYSRVWDALFDSLNEPGTINRPEHLGPILFKYLKLPGRLPPP